MGTDRQVDQPAGHSQQGIVLGADKRAGWLHHPLLPQLGPSVSLRVLQAIEVTDRSIWTNLPRRKYPRVAKSGDATGVWCRSYITFLLSVSGWLDPHIYNIYAECPVDIAIPCINASHFLTTSRSRNLGRGH